MGQLDMASIPLFDANAHPTVDGQWFGGKAGICFSSLVKEMEDYEINRACAVGMIGVGDYDDEAFIKACDRYQNLVPVAGINPGTMSDPISEIEKIQSLGFAGVKIHPRICGITLDSPELRSILTVCSDKQLPVFLCTYYWEKGESLYANNFDALIRLIVGFEDLPLVLVHGGVHDLLRLSEVTRYYSNVILDLSFTILKYEGSSLDMDIEYLFKHFDRRICVGSDQPEYGYRDLRRRFEHFARDISDEKKRNIAYRNLSRFLRMPGDVYQKG